jgi:hypothetical protein
MCFTVRMAPGNVKIEVIMVIKAVVEYCLNLHIYILLIMFVFMLFRHSHSPHAVSFTLLLYSSS